MFSNISRGNDPDCNGGKTGGGDGGGGKRIILGKVNYSQVVLLVISIMLFSCSIKKKDTPKSSTNSIEELKVKPDSDNDGISDELESLTGTNPLIADIPRLSIGLVRDISIGALFRPEVDNFSSNQFKFLKQEFAEVDNDRGGDLNFLKVLTKKIVINQYNHLRNIKAEKSDVITNEDLRSNILSGWDDARYYLFLDDLLGVGSISENDSGKFITNFKVYLDNLKNVTEVSDISVKSFFYNYETMSDTEIYNHHLIKESGTKERFKLDGSKTYAPVTIYPLIANELKSTEISSKLLDRNEVGIKFSDYSYMLSGIPLNYTEVMDKVFDGDAKIVFKSGTKTEVYFAAPGITLESVLAQKGLEIKFNKFGDIYSINGLESTAKYPIDIDTLTIDELKKGIWSIFGDADSLKETLKPRGLYIVGFSTIDEILKAGKKWTEIVESSILNTFNIENIIEGDELLINLENITKQYIEESIQSIFIPEYCSGSACNFIEDVNRDSECRCKPACTEYISKTNIKEVGEDIKGIDFEKWLSFKDGYGNIISPKVYKYGNNVKIKFQDLPHQLRNKITITLKNPKDITSTSRDGLVSSTCRTPSFASRSFENQFKLNGTIKIYGINKY